MTRVLKLWILGSAGCASAGWILSALHQLNVAGYAVFFSILACGLVYKFIHRRVEVLEGYAKARATLGGWKARRLRRPLALLFFLTATVALIGGIVHAPNNYDALTYRFPRVLHWWANSGWLWISTPNERMNLSGTGFEWLMMPLFIFTHSDRIFFLINIAAYLLLPALTFLVFTGAGLSSRAAWLWMWLMPAALCYAMQAGSISNDTIAVTYFLCALFFAFEARRTNDVRDVWYSTLAAALMTGVKASNLPLLLPVAWILLPSIKLLRQQFVASVFVVLLGLLVSFVPVALMNVHYTGDWSGDPKNKEQMRLQNPVTGVIGNCLQLTLQSLEPPFLPVARSAEVWLWKRFPESLKETLIRGFPRFVIGFRELPQEESAGAGIGITLIAIVSVAAAWHYRKRDPIYPVSPLRQRGLIIGVLTWVSFLVYSAKLGSEATSRLIAAYYPLLLLPFLLNHAQNILIRHRWFRFLGICASLIALMAVILTPSRPLWPAESFFDWAAVHHPKNELLAHAKTVYAVYRRRNDIFAEVRSNIPPSVSVIGLIENGDDAETSLWRPFGERRVVHILDHEHITEPSIQWLVVKNNIIARKDPKKFADWLERIGGSLVFGQPICEKAGAGLEQWSLIRLASHTN